MSPPVSLVNRCSSPLDLAAITADVIKLIIAADDGQNNRLAFSLTTTAGSKLTNSGPSSAHNLSVMPLKYPEHGKEKSGDGENLPMKDRNDRCHSSGARTQR